MVTSREGCPIASGMRSMKEEVPGLHVLICFWRDPIFDLLVDLL